MGGGGVEPKLCTFLTSIISYFQISPSLHRAPKNLGPNVSKVEEEKINVVLKPFAPKQHMIFKNVLANTRVTQDFTITNPDAFEVNVNFKIFNIINLIDFKYNCIS